MEEGRTRAFIITVPFLALICFPLINWNNRVVEDIRNFENRRLAQKPDLLHTPADSFPRRYESYFNDTFPLRSRMLRAYSVLNLKVWRKSPCPEYVTIGKDGWLFLTGDEFDAWNGKRRFTEAELERIGRNLEKRRRYLEEGRCKFYVMIVPVKAAVYPEKVPPEKIRYTDSTLGERLLGYLKKETKVACFDLYGLLREHKDEFNTYYHTDNHWTDAGALLATNEFLKAVHVDHPDVTPFSDESFEIVARDTFGGNTSDILGVKDLFGSVKYRLIPRERVRSAEGEKKGYVPPEKFPYPALFEEVREIKGSSLPALLIISDSFGNYVFPLLSEKFSRTVKIWDNWEYRLNEAIVESERPDVVLLVIHEKNLQKLLE
jgi:hypothetical protein